MEDDSISLAARQPIVKLIAFGGGVPGIEKALKRVKSQATAFPLIDEVETFSPADLGNDYEETFGHLVNDFPDGFALRSWKPYLVDRELNKLQDNDILIYMDAGCEINPRGEEVFSEYLDYTSRKGFTFFSIGLQQRHWTKPSELLVTSEHYFRNQVIAALFFIKVSDESRKFAKSWLALCALDRGYLLKEPEPDQDLGVLGFRAHRHDQSVLSKVVYELGIDPLKDGTYTEPWSLARRNPILAFRNLEVESSWIKAAFVLPPPLFTLWRRINIAISPGVFLRVLREKVDKKLHRS